MKRLMIVLVVVALFAGCKRGYKWKKYTYKDGAFSLMSPGKAKEQKHTLKPFGNGLKIKLRLFMYERGTRLFMYGYSDYPPVLLRFSKPKDTLEGAAKGSVKRFSYAKFRTKKMIKKDGHPGMELVVDGERKGLKFTYYARLYLRNNRLYQTVAMYPRGDNDKASKKFLDSFTFLPMPNAKATKRRAAPAPRRPSPRN